MGRFKLDQLVRIVDPDVECNGKLASVCSVLGDDGRYFVALQDEDNVILCTQPTQFDQTFSINAENLAHACNHCHQADVSKMQFCSKCRMAGYCNAECQRTDWQRHKVVCGWLTVHREISKSPLYMAACVGNLVEVQNLVQQGADVNKTNSDGTHPLFIAAQTGRVEIVRHLVQRGADKNRANTEGATPLYIGCHQGHLAVVKCLVEHGADKRLVHNCGTTPFVVALHKGHLSIVKYLVEQGVDVDKILG